MKQTLRQKQKLSLNITANLGNQIKLLSLSGFEISSKLNELINDYFEEEDKKLAYFKDEYKIDFYKNILFEERGSIGSFSENEDTNIQENLFKQLEITPLDPIQNLIGEFLIDSVEKDGRLDPELEFQDVKKIIKEDFNSDISDEEIEEVLKIIQNFDPPGCAFRNINESLDVQIENLDVSYSEKESLRKNLQSLLEKKVKPENLSEIHLKNLNKLSLNPAGSFGETSKNYIRPDIMAYQEENNWLVALNDNFMSKELLEKIRDKVESSKKNEVEDTKSFLKGLERRQQTLLVVSEFIVEAQRNFLNGKSGKRAISNKEIAEKLNISTSTISRIVRNKYIQLPNQVIPLKDLLERRINKHKEGMDVTSQELKYLLEELISNEDKSNPFSDENLKAALQHNFKVLLSRRTITKYRLDLHIPSSKERRTTI